MIHGVTSETEGTKKIKDSHLQICSRGSHPQICSIFAEQIATVRESWKKREIYGEVTNSDGIHSSAWDEMSLQQVAFISLRELFELQSPSSMTGMSYGHEESASWNGSRILSCMIPVTEKHD